LRSDILLIVAMSGESMDNWKQFQGTELGGIMSQIYGNQSKIKIDYPAVKTTIRKQKETFIPAGAKPDATDPRKSSRKEAKISMPKVGIKSVETPALIDCIPRRRNESKIKEELDDIKMRQTYYRPAYIKPISTDEEKDRFSQVCEYKGGKALPAELLTPAHAETPYEINEKLKAKERFDKLRGKQAQTKVLKKELSLEEQLAEQISIEIDERRKHLEDMYKIGVSVEEENRIKGEISKRIDELSKLENRL